MIEFDYGEPYIDGVAVDGEWLDWVAGSTFRLPRSLAAKFPVKDLPQAELRFAVTAADQEGVEDPIDWRYEIEWDSSVSALVTFTSKEDERLELERAMVLCCVPNVNSVTLRNTPGERIPRELEYSVVVPGRTCAEVIDVADKLYKEIHTRMEKITF